MPPTSYWDPEVILGDSAIGLSWGQIAEALGRTRLSLWETYHDKP